MRQTGQVFWLIALGGLPFAPFLWINKMDLWHAHTAWMHGWIAVTFSIVLWLGLRKTYGNPALGLYVLWVFLATWFSWTAFIIGMRVYNGEMLFPFFNYLAIFIAYISFTQLMDSNTLKKLLNIIAYTTVVLIGYGYVQLLNLDQMFKQTNMGSLDILVGTIGNPAHFCAYLACVTPIIAIKRGFWWRIVQIALAGLFLMFLIKYKSIGGIISACLALIYLSWYFSKKLFIGAVATFSVIAILSAQLIPGILSSSGRIAAWQAFWPYFQKKAMFGHGAGFIRMLSHSPDAIGTSINHWGHVHNEFYQAAIEQGIIGFVLVLFLVYSVFKLVSTLKKTPVVIILTAVLIAFTFNCLVNFPAHLWMVGALGFISYCGLYIIAEEQQTCSPH